MTKGTLVAIRDAYGQALAELGEERHDIVVLEADVGGSTKSILFGEKYPERYFNVGIAEGNMMAMAAGFASCGKIPFVNTFAVFATLRAGDPMRTLAAYTGMNVKIAGTYAGFSDSYDGATHQSVEDMAIVRAIPNMSIVVPTDGMEAKQAVAAVADYPGPVYLRLSRAAVPVLFNSDHPFEIGKGNTLTEGNDVAIIACGYMVHKALETAEILKADGIGVRVIEMHTIKPLDESLVLEAARDTGKIVTIEEHSVYGGLGSAVAELLAQQKPTPMQIIGIPDRFGESGDYAELLAQYGLDTASLVSRVRRFVNGC